MGNMEARQKNAVKWLLIACACLLISMIGASAIQSSGGKVQVKDISFVATTGQQIRAYLLVPPNATAETPAPALVACHGAYNSREMQDITYIEMSRRGYVVLAIDNLAHGFSDRNTSPSQYSTVPVYEAAKILTQLDFVDTDKIAVSGHSAGANASSAAARADNAADEQIISAVFLAAYNPVLTDSQTNEYINIYGSRHVGLNAPRYDEFFFRQTLPDGSRTATRDYLQTDLSQSFLHFGKDPTAETLEHRNSEIFYTETIGGVDATRIIFNTTTIHAGAHFSSSGAASMIKFFDEVFGLPTAISPDNQTWHFKQAFNLLGVIGFGMLLISLTTVLLYSHAFADLRSPELVQPTEVDPKSKRIFWAGMGIASLLSGVMYLPILKWVGSWPMNPLKLQNQPYSISVWALFNAIITIVILVISYRVYMKKNSMDLAERGVWISKKKLLKTLLLGLIVVAGTYGTVFIADYFFNTDFRLFLFAIRPFPPYTLIVMIPTFINLFIFFTSNSISANCFNYNTIGGKPWVNTGLAALGITAGPLAVYIIQYATFFTTGIPAFQQIPGGTNYAMFVCWLLATVLSLPFAAIISRKIYKQTNNPYLAGFIIALAFTLMNCAHTSTVLL